jgi:hypothetical protein
MGDGEVDSVVIGTAEDLVHLFAKEENLGVLLRSGRIRHLQADEDGASRDIAMALEMFTRRLMNGR